MELTEIILGILSSLAVISASIVAIFGIKRWSVEYKGKKQIDLAEEVLSLFYEARDRIRAIRSPFSWQGEGETRKAEPDESPEKKKIRDHAYVVYERYQNHHEFFNDLRSKQYRFRSHFGEDKWAPFRDLFDILDEILKAGHILGIYREQISDWGLNKEIDKDYIDKIHQYEAKIWGGIDDDEIGIKIDDAIKRMEEICKETMNGI